MRVEGKKLRGRISILFIYIVIFMAILSFSIAVYGEDGQLMIVSERAKGHYDSGINKLAGKLYDKAIQEFSTAIELEPGYVDAYIRLSEAYLAMGNEPEAIKAYESGLQKGYDFLTIPYDELKPVFHDIAIAYYTAGKDDAGKGVIEKLKSLAHNRPKVQYRDAPEQSKSKGFVIEPQTTSSKRADEKNVEEIKKVWNKKLPGRSALFIFSAVVMVVVMLVISR